MLDVTDKGTINQVLTYSNSANANGFIEAFEIFRNLLGSDGYCYVRFFLYEWFMQNSTIYS